MILHPPIEFPAHEGRLRRQRFDSGFDHYTPISQRIDAHHFDRGEYPRAKLFITEKFVAHARDDRERAVGICSVRQGCFEDVKGIFAGQVRQGGDGSVGDYMDRAIFSPQNGGPKIDLLNHAGDGVDYHQIADADLVFEQ